MITGLLFTSMILLLAGMLLAVWRNGWKIPTSVSATVYLLPQQWRIIWTVWLWAVTLTAAPSLMAAIPCGWQWLGWLTVIGLMVTACLPLGSSVTDTKEHNIFAAVAGVFSQLCVVTISPIWLLAWVLPCWALIALSAIPKRWAYNAIVWIRSKFILLLEVLCVVALYGAMLSKAI